MEFTRSQKWLEEKFQRHHFMSLCKKKRFHAVRMPVASVDGYRIFVVFPGYKTRCDMPTPIYDYRVDIEKDQWHTSLSHANIIVDIYRKIRQGMPVETFRQILIEAFRDKRLPDMDTINATLGYVPVRHQDSSLISRMQTLHRRLGKVYNVEGNRYDLPLGVFFSSIKWIVLQEDINYPMDQGYEGRKMPLARYIEAITVAHTPKGYALEDVVTRALMHTRPSPWMHIDYSFLSTITSG